MGTIPSQITSVSIVYLRNSISYTEFQAYINTVKGYFSNTLKCAKYISLISWIWRYDKSTWLLIKIFSVLYFTRRPTWNPRTPRRVLYPICKLGPKSTGFHTQAWDNNQLQWRHDGRDGVSNHQPCDCSLNRLYRCRSKKTPSLRVTGLCVGNSPVTGEFHTQRASNAENVCIWWRHHAYLHMLQQNCCLVVSTPFNAFAFAPITLPVFGLTQNYFFCKIWIVMKNL